VNEKQESQRTRFHLLDLAGAERPNTTGSERPSALEVIMKLAAGKKMDVGDQGTMINYELTELLTLVSRSNDSNAKGKKI
jgi:hypothetical protein